jgi:hypothetical protein
VKSGKDETRTASVGCLSSDITTALGSGNAEKKLKALCTWRDAQGGCHAVRVETTIVRF